MSTKNIDSDNSADSFAFQNVKKTKKHYLSNSGKAVIENMVSDNLSVSIQAIFSVVVIAIVWVLFQANIGFVANDFTSIRWGANKIDPSTGETVMNTGSAGTGPMANPDKSVFLTWVFNSIGMFAMFIISLVVFSMGGSRDIIFMIRRWIPKISSVVVSIISAIPIFLFLLALVVSVIALAADSNNVSVYYYFYGVCTIVLSMLCIGTCWARFYIVRKEGESGNLSISIARTIVNLLIVVYGAALIGVWSSTSVEVVNYLKSKATTYRSVEGSRTINTGH